MLWTSELHVHSCTGRTQDIGYKLHRGGLEECVHCTMSSMSDVLTMATVVSFGPVMELQEWNCHWWLDKLHHLVAGLLWLLICTRKLLLHSSTPTKIPPPSPSLSAVQCNVMLLQEDTMQLNMHYTLPARICNYLELRTKFRRDE